MFINHSKAFLIIESLLNESIPDISNPVESSLVILYILLSGKSTNSFKILFQKLF